MIIFNFFEEKKPFVEELENGGGSSFDQSAEKQPDIEDPISSQSPELPRNSPRKSKQMNYGEKNASSLPDVSFHNIHPNP